MTNTIEYYALELIGNKKAKSGDQISEWLHPKVEEMKSRMNDWDWSKPFEFEMPEKTLVSDFDDILKDNGLPDKLPEIGKLVLFDSSKLTDFVKGSFLEQYGLIVSKNAKVVLKRFNIGIHKFYPLTLTHKGVDYNSFYFLKCITQSREHARRQNIDLVNVNDFETAEIIVSKNLKEPISRLTGVKLKIQ